MVGISLELSTSPFLGFKRRNLRIISANVWAERKEPPNFFALKCMIWGLFTLDSCDGDPPTLPTLPTDGSPSQFVEKRKLAKVKQRRSSQLSCSQIGNYLQTGRVGVISLERFFGFGVSVARYTKYEVPFHKCLS